ncbi:hypothetical protein [Natronomonas marina]|jgi:hypothetical protein|uniref:hypothetical protein n=1 Tax=Natronomonas marina TaxID=2961939 RepID=UPI0020C99882|nr:hypothetical protein [Natronomonas marina]
MREDLIDSIHDRLDEMRSEASTEQSRQIREVQQMVVGIRESADPPADDPSVDD